MRVRRRAKSKKVRRSLGRSISRPWKSNTSTQSNGFSANSSSEQRSSALAKNSKKLHRLKRKKAKNRKASALLSLYSALEKRNLDKKKGLSKPTAEYYSFDGRLTCVAENCEAFNEFCRDANFRDTDARDLILKLLGDKNSFTVCCYDEEASQLQDMDLMILGSSPDEYKRYTQLLRLEYQCMNDFDYKQMRLKVLQTLLMIPNIFACVEYQAKYEQQARTNIKQEIELLKH